MASGTSQNPPAPNSPPTGTLPVTAAAVVERTKRDYGGSGLPGTQNAPGPDTQSADAKCMQPLWDKVAAIAGGTDGMRAAAGKYLPKLELEETADYNTRIASSPFTSVYEEIVSALAAKPFSREVQFDDPEDVDDVFHQLAEDIDGRGNSLHVYASETFRGAIDNAMDWILVDYTRLPPLSPGQNRSLADEQRLGARPYWVRVAASSVRAAYSDMVRGKEVIHHVRFYEPALVRDGYEERIAERYRIFERSYISAADSPDGQPDYGPAAWRVEEKKVDPNTKKVTWDVVEYGQVDIGIIPMVPVRLGKRKGNGWAAEGPVSQLVEMQIDGFQQESNKRSVEQLAAFPMLTGSGVAPPAAPGQLPGATGPAPAPPRMKVGPRAVLWAPPPHGGGQPGSWSYIEPSGTSLTYLAGQLEKHWDRMRQIGMQPLAEQSTTVINSANVSVKASCVLQAWAYLLEDALEQAMVVTAMWLRLPEDRAPGIDVYKDFGVDLQNGAAMDTLEKMAENGKLSGETLRAEAKRRNILSDNFDEAEEQERLANEAAADAENVTGDEDDEDAVTGDGEDGDAEDPDAEPADPAQFASADDIDDDTLAALFGADAVAAAEER